MKINQFVPRLANVCKAFRFYSCHWFDEVSSQGRAFGVIMFVVLYTLGLGKAAAGVHRMTRDEGDLFRLISKHRLQMRRSIQLDPLLCRLARIRASDMLKRNYFSHVTPDGKGANLLARELGYHLPIYYDARKDANNIESIGSGLISPSKILALWVQSDAHRVHLMAEVPFYKEQTRVGVGIVRGGKPAVGYFVFLSAPANLNPKPPRWVLRDHKNRFIGTSRPLANSWWSIKARQSGFSFPCPMQVPDLGQLWAVPKWKLTSPGLRYAAEGQYPKPHLSLPG